MIERLSLKKFGRFANREFEFGSSVIFFGPNESGKTTIFDALFTTLCRVPRQGDYKNSIYLRYGDAMQAELAPEELAESFDTREFDDLHAIRSGDVNLTFNDGSPWADAVKNALFSGGIDPAAVADDLESRAAEGAGRKHNREIALRKKTLAQLTAERDRLEGERARHAAQVRSSDDLAQRLRSTEEAIQGCDESIARLTAELEHETAIERRRDLEEAQRLLDREADLRGELDRLPVVAPADLSALGECDAAIPRLQAEVRSLTADAAEKAREIREQETERRAVESRQLAEASLARKAEGLLVRINDLTGSARRMKTITRWNVPLIIVSAVIALASAVAGVFVHPAFFAGLLALAGSALARRTETVEDTEALDRLRTEVRDEFRNAGGKDLMSDSLQGIAGELRQVIAAYDGLAAGLQRIGADLERLRERASQTEERRGETERRLREAEERRGAILQRVVAPNREELLTRVGARKSLTDQWEAAVSDNRKRMAAAGFSEQPSYASDIRRRLADADARGIPREGATPAALQRTRNLLQAEQEKRRKLGQDRERMKVDRGFAEGTMSAMGRVLEDLVGKEKEIARTEAEIADLELNKMAAALAAEVFRTMAADAGAMLSSLAGEMQTMFQGLVDLPRTVEVSGFDSGMLQAMDAGGAVRGIGHLSKGTRDTLMFAARLTLALRSDPAGEKRLLVLDEPFASLDPARIGHALALVRRMQDAHGWQVVLFTKDPALADAAVSVLKDPVRHDLA